jgi:type VI secretion system secreted protein Hcp
MKTSATHSLLGRLCALALTLCALALGASTSRAQNVDYFLKFTGGAPAVAGESVAEGFENQVEVVSYGFAGATQVQITPGQANDEVSPTAFGEVNFVLLMDAKAVAPLMQRMATRLAFDKVELTGRRVQGGQSFTFMKFELEVGYVTVVSVQGNSGDRPVVNVAMVARRVRLITTPQNPNGSPGTSVFFGWDYKTNLPL